MSQSIPQTTRPTSAALPGELAGPAVLAGLTSRSTDDLCALACDSLSQSSTASSASSASSTSPAKPRPRTVRGLPALTPRYEALLVERVILGRVFVDTVCHRDASTEAESLFRDVQRLERRLERFRRWSHDRARTVQMAEDKRFHVPGQPPAGPECHLCVKEGLALPVTMVLPARSLTAASTGALMGAETRAA